MGIFKEKFKKDILSFSRISSYGNCPYEFKLHYYDDIESEGNFFAEAGSTIHEVLEAYLKQEIDMFDLPDYFESKWCELVVHDAPPNKYTDIKENYYNQCKDYIDNLCFDFNKYKVLGVEKKVEFNIDEYKFQGFIDLLLQDNEGHIIVSDHKSANIKKLKNGGISKSDREHFDSFKKQLYLYSLGLKDEYPKIDYLRWNLFRLQDEIVIPYDEEEFNQTIEWARQRIKDISEEELFLPNTDNSFYCNFLCGMRNSACEYKNN